MIPAPRLREIIAELDTMAREYEQALPGNSEIRALRVRRVQALRDAAAALDAAERGRETLANRMQSLIYAIPDEALAEYPELAAAVVTAQLAVHKAGADPDAEGRETRKG